MKKILLLLTVLLCFSGCSKDEVDPDLTKNFVGFWDSGWIQYSDTYLERISFEISKETNNSINLTSHYQAKIADVTEEAEGTTQGIRVVDPNRFEAEDPATEENEYTKSEITGTLSANTLTVIMKYTDIKTGDVDFENLVLKRK